MQLYLTFEAKETVCLPLNYNHAVQSALYRKLGEVDAGDQWHNGGFGEKNFKGYTFGRLRGEHYVKGKEIFFTRKISLEVRSSAFDFIDSLQRSLEREPFLLLGGQRVSLCDVRLSNKHICGETAEFVTDSPVAVYKTQEETGKTVFYSPEDEEFCTALKSNFEKKYLAVMGETPPKIEIRPIGTHKKVVTKYKSTWITAYDGKYRIFAQGKGLEFIYNSGLGSKNSQGFGMLNVLE